MREILVDARPELGFGTAGTPQVLCQGERAVIGGSNAIIDRGRGVDSSCVSCGRHAPRVVHGDHALGGDEDEFVQRAGLRPSCRLDIEDGVRVMRVLAMNHLGFRSVSDSPAPQPMQKED